MTRVRGCAEEMLVPSPLLRALCVAVVSELQVRVNMGSFIRMASEKARRSFRWRLSVDFAALSSRVHKGGVQRTGSGLCQVFGKGNKPQRHAALGNRIQIGNRIQMRDAKVLLLVSIVNALCIMSSRVQFHNIHIAAWRNNNRNP